MSADQLKVASYIRQYVYQKIRLLKYYSLTVTHDEIFVYNLWVTA